MRVMKFLNAVEQAFDYELLILGYRQTAHHAKVTLSEHLFEHNDEITMESKDQLIQMLESLKDRQQFQDALLAQKHMHTKSRVNNSSKFLNRRSKAKKKKQSKIKHHLI